jgi:hypothetical protein
MTTFTTTAVKTSDPTESKVTYNYVMKTYGSGRYIDPLVGGEWSASRPGRFTAGLVRPTRYGGVNILDPIRTRIPTLPSCSSEPDAVYRLSCRCP